MSVLEGLLPERSSEDVLAGRIPVSLGSGEDLRVLALPVLAIRPERTWKALLEEKMQGLWSGLDRQADVRAVMAYLGSAFDVQVELLRAYDRDGMIPDTDWLEEHATGAQLLSALLAIIAAAYPFLEAAMEMVRRNPQMVGSVIRQILTTVSSPPTNGALPTTAGSQPRSKRR